MASSTSNRSGDIGGGRNSLDSAAILKECCEQSVACRLQLVHCVYSVSATFFTLHEEWVEMVLPKDGESHLIQHAICCISFTYGTSYCAFLGCLVDVRQHTPGKVRIVATFPKQLTVTNLRQSFRVPVIESSGLETIIRTFDAQEFHVVAHNITESGMEVEFPERTDYGLTPGASVSVELRFRGEIVLRSAEVRRISENYCGLVFASPLDVQSQNAAARMRGIVLSLQQMWLKSRLN
jgi:hypothetical protein